MTRKPSSCTEIADDLLAAAIGEATPDAAQRVERHVAECGSCHRELQGYRVIDEAVDGLRGTPVSDEQAAHARGRLDARLAWIGPGD
jgi:anti-sigma factor RsiW